MILYITRVRVPKRRAFLLHQALKNTKMVVEFGIVVEVCLAVKSSVWIIAPVNDIPHSAVEKAH